MKTCNGIIVDVILEMEKNEIHECLVPYIVIQFKEGTQSFGGITNCDITNFFDKVFTVLKVKNTYELIGKPVIAKRDDTRIESISHFMDSEVEVNINEFITD